MCANNRRAHMEVADRAVLDAIESSVLNPAAIDYVIDRAVQIIVERRAREPNALEKVQSEIKQVQRRIENLLKAIAQGDAPQAIVSEIQRMEESVAAKQALAERLNAEVPTEFDLRRLKRAARERLGKFKDLVRSEIPLARQGLRKLLVGPIEFVPEEGKNYRLRGETRIGPLFDLALASPQG